jgi:hypothetical protein
MRTLRWATAMVAVAALSLPSSAAAGGFATVGLSSLPDGTTPGRPWHLTLTILQHGRTPLSDLRPAVRIRRVGGGPARTFHARSAGRPGVYRVDVVFPSAGTWRYAIDDGFSLTHTFAPVAIGSSRPVAAPAQSAPAATTPAPARGDDGGGGGDVGAALTAAAGAGLLAGLLSALAIRRRRPEPAATPAPAP